MLTLASWKDNTNASKPFEYSFCLEVKLYAHVFLLLPQRPKFQAIIKWVIYQVACKGCDNKYLGKTELYQQKPLYQHYEHTKTNNMGESLYCQHSEQSQHTFDFW